MTSDDPTINLPARDPLTSEEYMRIWAAIEETAAMDATARWDRLSVLLGGDRRLIEEARALIDAQDALPPDEPGEERSGDRFGPWCIAEPIGRGGMGTVYVGHRADAQYERRVAIKLLRGDVAALDPRHVTRRFSRERLALGRLDHPGIARIIDAGATPEGRAFLVMDFVDGTPIDRHCEVQQLGVRQRLSLVLDVCAAVRHAHDRLVVHRDIKPSNVLVTADGPVLLDFGIARLLADGQDADDVLTVLTRQGMGVGTPAFASPEQLAGDAPHVTMDVYGIGALLYLLLTGARAEPPTASTPVRRPSTVTGLTPARALRGDLDAICGRAMAFDPSQRYASVADLAADVQRYGSGHPVLARPQTVVYRIGVMARRHWPWVLAVAAVVVAGVLGATNAASRLREMGARAAALEQQRRVTQAHAAETDRLADLMADAVAADNGTARAPAVAAAIAAATEQATRLHDAARRDPALVGAAVLAYQRAARLQAVGSPADRREALRSHFNAVQLLEFEGRQSPRSVERARRLVVSHQAMAEALEAVDVAAALSQAKQAEAAARLWVELTNGAVDARRVHEQRAAQVRKLESGGRTHLQTPSPR